MTLDDLRKEVITIIEGVYLAEREACAKLAENNGGRRIARVIRARPLLKLPPLSFESVLAIGEIVPQEKKKRK